MANKKKISVKQYFHDLKFEIKKVTWPKMDSVMKSTVVIIIVMIFTTLFVTGCDLFFSKGIEIIKNNITRLV